MAHRLPGIPLVFRCEVVVQTSFQIRYLISSSIRAIIGVVILQNEKKNPLASAHMQLCKLSIP